MYTHLTEQLADQHQADMHAQSPRNGQVSRARRSHRHPIRRRTGYALVSLGLRLVSVAAED